VTDQAIPRAAVVVAMPGDIDYGTAGQAYGRLYAALTAGAAVVIADFTVTSYCDCTALRYLLAVQDRAAASDAELRLAVPLASPVRRVLRITGLDEQFRLYPSAGYAAAGSWVPGPRSPHS
jgi:anti-anti-sigma factor